MMNDEMKRMWSADARVQEKSPPDQLLNHHESKMKVSYITRSCSPMLNDVRFGVKTREVINFYNRNCLKMLQN